METKTKNSDNKTPIKQQADGPHPPSDSTSEPDEPETDGSIGTTDYETTHTGENPQTELDKNITDSELSGAANTIDAEEKSTDTGEVHMEDGDPSRGRAEKPARAQHIA